MKNLAILLAAGIALAGAACSGGRKNPPVDLSPAETGNKVCIPYTEFAGVKTIPVKLNGVSMDIIFDTGCSGMTISLHELKTLLKNGQLKESDFLNETTSAQTADGNVTENAMINLREVEIGGKVFTNIKASIIPAQEAPILLGNGVLDKVASVEVDNINKTINFTLR